MCNSTRMNKPSKSKAEHPLRISPFTGEILPQWSLRENIPHRLQLMQRTVFPSILQSAEDERRERNKDLEYESRVDYASWETDGQEDQ